MCDLFVVELIDCFYFISFYQHRVVSTLSLIHISAGAAGACPSECTGPHAFHTVCTLCTGNSFPCMYFQYRRHYDYKKRTGINSCISDKEMRKDAEIIYKWYHPYDEGKRIIQWGTADPGRPYSGSRFKKGAGASMRGSLWANRFAGSLPDALFYRLSLIHI